MGTNYRKIYEENVGPIPADANGVTYDIHHIDVNRANNKIDNLICVSLQEHYNIHYRQGDWAACSAILLRMNTSKEELSRLIRLDNKERIENGTHHFLKTGPSHHSYNHELYIFENISTGEIITSTVNNFIIKTGITSKHIYGLVKKTSRIQSVKGWKIKGTEIGREKIYTFINNETKEKFTGTCLSFRTTYNLNQGNVSSMVKNTKRSVKGWRLLNS